MAAARAEFIGYIITETPRAFLFQDHYWENPDWLPKSQVNTTRNINTTEVKITTSPWIATQKGIDEFQYRDATLGVVPEKEG